MKNKPTTTNEYQQRVNRVIEYIREHLCDDIDLQALAEVSAFSPFHIHRILSAFLGEPVGEFIVRTRMEAAARLLRYSDLAVAEIAYRVGYDAPSSLTKAFRRSFGVSPSVFRTLKTLPMMKDSVQSQNKPQGRLSKPKLMVIPEKPVAYIRAGGNYNSVDYGAYFVRMWQYIKTHKLFSAGIEHLVVYHSDPDITPSKDLRCDVCMVLPKGPVADGEVGVKTVGGGRYAVFLHTGPYAALGEAYRKICGEWLPSSGCELRDAPCFEKYINRPDRVSADKLKTEIYLPIK